MTSIAENAADTIMRAIRRAKTQSATSDTILDMRALLIGAFEQVMDEAARRAREPRETIRRD